MLSNTRQKRTRAIILIFSSTGIRVSALCGLKMRDVSTVENSKCKCFTIYAGEIEQYFAFLTPEASKALDDYLQERIDTGEKFDDDTPLITINEGYNRQKIKNRAITRPAISNIFETLFRKQKRTRDRGGRFEISTIHGFRKTFNKALKMRDGCNLSICEKLMGHSVTISLDNAYLPVDEKELFVEFEKAIPDLTIREDERSLLRIEALEKDRKSEEDKEKENQILREEMVVLKLRMERFENSKEIPKSKPKQRSKGE